MPDDKNSTAALVPTQVTDLRFTYTDLIKFGGMILTAAVVWVALNQEIQRQRGDIQALSVTVAALQGQVSDLKANNQMLQERINVEVPQKITEALADLKQDIRWIVQRLSQEDRKK